MPLARPERRARRGDLKCVRPGPHRRRRLRARGRGARARRGAPDQRADRRPAVHLGAHRREPRLVAAAQARRGRPPRAGRAGRCAAAAPDATPAGAVAAGAADLVRRPGGRAARRSRMPSPSTGWSPPSARAAWARPGWPWPWPRTSAAATRRRLVRRPGAGHRPGDGGGRGGGRLGFGEQPGRSPADTVVAKLAGAEVLLVLDNCEHLLDGVGVLRRAAARRRARASRCWPPAGPGCGCPSSRSSRCPGCRSSEAGEATRRPVPRARGDGGLVVAVPGRPPPGHDRLPPASTAWRWRSSWPPPGWRPWASTGWTAGWPTRWVC